MASGTSLRALARRVGISASFLSQVELGRAVPSIGTLYSIVSELDLSMDGLLGSGPSADVSEQNAPARATMPAAVTASATKSTPNTYARGDGIARIPGTQRATDRPRISVEGVQWERLTTRDDPLVEFLRVTYGAGSESCSPDNMMRHAGWEYVHLLSGRLDIQVGFDADTYEAGDSVNFESSVPHRLSNPYEEDCVALWVVVGRHGYGDPRVLAERLENQHGGSSGPTGTHYAASTAEAPHDDARPTAGR